MCICVNAICDLCFRSAPIALIRLSHKECIIGKWNFTLPVLAQFHLSVFKHLIEVIEEIMLLECWTR